MAAKKKQTVEMSDHTYTVFFRRRWYPYRRMLIKIGCGLEIRRAALEAFTDGWMACGEVAKKITAGEPPFDCDPPEDGYEQRKVKI